MEFTKGEYELLGFALLKYRQSLVRQAANPDPILRDHFRYRISVLDILSGRLVKEMEDASKSS